MKFKNSLEGMDEMKKYLSSTNFTSSIRYERNFLVWQMGWFEGEAILMRQYTLPEETVGVLKEH